MFYAQYRFSENRAGYHTDWGKSRYTVDNYYIPTFGPPCIMWKNIVEPDRPQMTIWRMRFACWIPKATSTV